jgi:hypothetical protein
MQLYQDNLDVVLNHTPGEERASKKLGKAKVKGSTKLLSLAPFLKEGEVKIPPKFNFWEKRKPFPEESFGNTRYGSCTKSSQALAAMRVERIEQRRTIDFDDQEIIDNYLAMTSRLYGGGDTGAFELDALSEWRKPDLSFRDKKGRPHTIDAYVALNPRNLEELKKAIFVSGAHGIKVCFNLPAAWSNTLFWDIPEGALPIEQFEPGSWGGHSMFSPAYDEEGLILPHTWNLPDGKITWRGVAQYCDEAYLIIDSVNAWKKRKAASAINFKALVSAVNEVSSQKIAA